MEVPVLTISAPDTASVTDQIDRHRRVWFAVVGVFLLLAFNGQWIIGPDTAAYRQLGHQLATKGRYFFRDDVPGLSEYHNKQGTLYPGLPIVLAGFEKTFGSGPLAPLVFMLLVSALTLVLIYRLMLYRLERWAAVCVVVGVGTNPKFLQCANEILSDVPFLLGVIMTLLGYEWVIRATDRGRLIRGLVLSFGGLLLAAVMRPTFWFLFAALIVACLWGVLSGRAGLAAESPDRTGDSASAPGVRRGSVLLAIVLGLTFVLFWFGLDIRMKHAKGLGSGGYEARAAGKLAHFGSAILPALPENLGEMLENALPMATLGFRSGVGLIRLGSHRLAFGTAFSLAIIAAGAWLSRRNVLWGAMVAITVVLLTLMGSVPRYFVTILPLLLAGWGIMIWRFAGWFQSPWQSALVLRLGLGLILGLNVAASADFILTQRGITRALDEHNHWQGWHHVGFLHAYHYGYWAGVYDLADMVHREVGPDEKILGPEPTILTYLSGRQIYPSQQELVVAGAGKIFHRALFPVGTGRQMVEEYDKPLKNFMKAGLLREGEIDSDTVSGYRLSDLEVPAERAE
jgi:hypothetical protein